MSWCLAVAGFCLFLPARGEAAIIQCLSPSAACQEIGLFSWSVGTADDDVFTLTNLSGNASVPPGGGDFTAVDLDIDGSSGFSTAIVGVGDQIDSGLVDFFVGTSLARLQFTYQGAPFTAQLTGPGDQALLAQAIVPEPATILMLGSGLVALGLRRRWRR